VRLKSIKLVLLILAFTSIGGNIAHAQYNPDIDFKFGKLREFETKVKSLESYDVTLDKKVLLVRKQFEKKKGFIQITTKDDKEILSVSTYQKFNGQWWIKKIKRSEETIDFDYKFDKSFRLISFSMLKNNELKTRVGLSFAYKNNEVLTTWSKGGVSFVSIKRKYDKKGNIISYSENADDQIAVKKEFLYEENKNVTQKRTLVTEYTQGYLRLKKPNRTFIIEETVRDSDNRPIKITTTQYRIKDTFKIKDNPPKEINNLAMIKTREITYDNNNKVKESESNVQYGNLARKDRVFEKLTTTKKYNKNGYITFHCETKRIYETKGTWHIKSEMEKTFDYTNDLLSQMSEKSLYVARGRAASKSRKHLLTKYLYK